MEPNGNQPTGPGGMVEAPGPLQATPVPLAPSTREAFPPPAPFTVPSGAPVAPPVDQEPEDPQARLFRETATIGLDLVLVSRYSFRDEDGQLLHTEQREAPILGAGPAERAQAAMAATRGAVDLRQRFLLKAQATREQAARQRLEQQELAREREA